MTEGESKETGALRAEPSPGEELSAIYVNYFHAHVAPAMTRIEFAEQDPFSKNAYYRVAIAMTTENTKLLVALLSRLITESEKPKSN